MYELNLFKITKKQCKTTYLNSKLSDIAKNILRTKLLFIH